MEFRRAALSLLEHCLFLFLPPLRNKIDYCDKVSLRSLKSGSWALFSSKQGVFSEASTGSHAFVEVPRGKSSS